MRRVKVNKVGTHSSSFRKGMQSSTGIKVIEPPKVLPPAEAMRQNWIKVGATMKKTIVCVQEEGPNESR